MSLRRVPSILQSVAQVRNWVVEHVPGTDSMLGYDLFIKLGNDVVAGQPLQVSALAPHLPYTLETIAAHLRRFEELGLLTLSNDAEHGLVLHPTQQFITLLNQYSLVFERKFIVRDDLRRKQLLVQSGDAELAGFCSVLYDRVYDMGWLYLYNFGSTCFMMASLMRRLAEVHGHQARVVSCHVEIQGPEAAGGEIRYRLGAPGYAKPGQIAGHAACLIDDKLVIDFGLGNVRRYYRRNFYWGAVADYQRDGAVFARLALPDGDTMVWKDDYQSPDGDTELARCGQLLDELTAEYLQRFR
jgi:hypothetical protein